MCLSSFIVRYIEIFSKERTTRIAKSTGGVVVSGKSHHFLHTRFIKRSQQCHIGDGSEIGDIERPLMCFSVFPDDTCTVDGERHSQIHQTDIMDDLIVTALQKGGVNGTKGLEPLFCKRPHGSDGMLLRNRNVPKTLRVLFHCCTQSRTAWHGSRYTDDLFIFIGHVHQCFRKDLCSGLGTTLFKRLSCFGIKSAYTVPVFFGTLGNLVSLAFCCLRMDNNRFPKTFGYFHCLNKCCNIMPIHRTYVFDAHLFEQYSRGNQFKTLLEALCHICGTFRKDFQHLLHFSFKLLIKRACHRLRKQFGDRTNRFGNTHFIIIQNDHHRILPVSKLVERFIDHSRTHTAVTDKSDRNTILLLQGYRLGRPDCQRDGSRTVPGNIIVIR